MNLKIIFILYKNVIPDFINVKGDYMKKATEYKTKQKQSILSYLERNKDKCLTAEAIYGELSKDEKSVGLTTIYRTLKALTESGVVREYSATKGRTATYQYVERQNCTGHLHLKCVVCGNVHHVDCDFNDSISGHFLSHHNFKMDNARTVIYGTCKDCCEKEA